VTNVLASLLLVPLAACSLAFGGEEGDGVPARGTGTARTFDVSGFTEVALAGSDDVEVRVGPAFSVRAEGPADVLDRLRIERRGDALTVGRKQGVNLGRAAGKARVLVTLPRIAEASLAGSGNMRVDRVEGDRFEGSLAGSGGLAVGALAVREAEFNLAGSGGLSAAGRTDRLEVSVAGSGSADARGLSATRAEVSVAGSGSVRAAVNGEAEVNVIGSGDVDLGPNARCEVSRMGSGKVRCGG